MGKPSGGGGSVTTPTVNVPPGLFQGLSGTQGLATYGQSLFDPLAGMTNWASQIATGGLAGGGQIPPFNTVALQTGPTVNIGSGGPPGHDTWSTQFDPQTGQITFTNSQTGGQFQEWVGSSQAAQYFSPQQIQAWTNLYNNRGATSTSAGAAGMGVESLYGPQLGAAWNQIQSIPGLEQQTQAFTNQENLQAQQLYSQGQQLYGEGQQLIGQGGNILGQGEHMLHQITTGSGLYPSQQTYVQQGVTAEQASLQQQLASEGLASSTAAGILTGEAAQQGAATAGQLIQGNIGAAQQQEALGQQQIGLGQQQTSLAQQQFNLAQGAQKLALGGQELSLGETTAMAQLAMGFQGQMWSQAMQGYGALGQLMNSLGNIYGIDIQGQTAILSAETQTNLAAAQAQLQQQQLAAGAAAAQGQGLGQLLGGLSGSGGSSGGLLGGLGSLFSGIGGGLSATGIAGGTSLALSPAAASAVGAGSSAVAAGGSSLLSAIGPLIAGIFSF